MLLSIVTIDSGGNFHDTNQRVDESILLIDEKSATSFVLGQENNRVEDPEELAAQETEWGMSDMLNPPHAFKR
jgi:hypothetical protein|tara:strand:- start:568 stop:786 length:219 start_codon:yes stop_codon:yes gene_type:complete